MLNIVRNIGICRSTNFHRLNSFIRFTNTLHERHKEQSIKGKDFFVDPNLVKAFNKIKQGDFSPAIMDKMVSEHEENQTKFSQITNDKKLSNKENIFGKLVYIGKLDKPFKAAKSLSLASSIGGLICYPIMLPKILEETSMIIAIAYSIVSATFVILTPSLIQLICKRYLTSLYYDERTGDFTGFYKNFFMMERKVRFRCEDVQVPPITGMFTSMLVKNKPFFINHDDFFDRKILIKMLGYDKEFDFDKYTKDIENNRKNE